MIDVKVDKGDTAALRAALQALMDEWVPKFVGETLEDLAKQTAEWIKYGYSHYPGSVDPATINTYAYGKRRGRTPVRNVYTGTRPLYRTGTLADSVVVDKRVSRVRTIIYTVGMPKNVRYTAEPFDARGRKLRPDVGGIAQRLELGWVQTSTMTGKAAAYLAALQRASGVMSKAEPGSKHAKSPRALTRKRGHMPADLASRAVGKPITIWHRPRPLWAVTFRRANGKARLSMDVFAKKLTAAAMEIRTKYRGKPG